MTTHGPDDPASRTDADLPADEPGQGDPPDRATTGPAAPDPILTGPPGGRIFTLEDRPVPGVYLIAWLCSVGGVVALFVTLLAQPSPARSIIALGAVISLGIGLAAAAGYQLVVRAGRSAMEYRGPSPLLLFGLVLVLSTLASALLGVLGLVDPDRPLGFLAGLVVVGASYVIAIWLLVVRTGALSWSEMGWPTFGPGLARVLLRDAGIAFLVMIPVTLGVLLWGGLLARVLQVTAPQTLPDAHTPLEALAVLLGAVVVAPVGEEAFFRGFTLTAWWRDLGRDRALALSALFFAVVHILNIRVAADQASQGLGQALLEFGVILPLGLALGWLFQRRGLVAAIAGHMTYNGVLLVLLVLASG